MSGPRAPSPGPGPRAPGHGPRVLGSETQTRALRQGPGPRARACNVGDSLGTRKPGKPGKPAKNHQKTIPATLPQTLPKPSQNPPQTLQSPQIGGRPSAAHLSDCFWRVWGGFLEGLGGGWPGGCFDCVWWVSKIPWYSRREQIRFWQRHGRIKVSRPLGDAVRRGISRPIRP